jgi:hypothetical protein
VLTLVEASEIELTPLEIAERTEINHSTVRGYCCQLLNEGKIFQPYKGAYCSKITHGMIFCPLRVHNLIISVDAPWLDFSDDLTEFVGDVKVRVQFGLERRRLTGRVSCDSGMDRNAVVFALNHCYDLMRQRTGHVVENVVVKTFEVNRDYQGCRIDGAKCYTVKGLFDVLERIYQKEDSVVRTEYKVTKDMTIDEFQVLMQGGVTGYNLQQAVFALAQEVRAQKEAQKFTNEKLGQVANLLEALLNKIVRSEKG